MQKITVDISAKGYTGLTAENIKKALDYYFGSPVLNVSFSVTESRPTLAAPDVCACGHSEKEHSFYDDHSECDKCECENGFTPVS
jgi:hypothetical protein